MEVERMNLEKDSVKRAKKGTGTIRQVPSGKYEYRVSYYDDLGKRKRKSFSCWSPEECIEKAETFLTRLAQLSRGMDPDSTIVDIMRSKVENDYQKNYTGEQGYDSISNITKKVEIKVADRKSVV